MSPAFANKHVQLTFLTMVNVHWLYAQQDRATLNIQQLAAMRNYSFHSIQSYSRYVIRFLHILLIR